MSQIVPPELQEWDEIIDVYAGADNSPAQGKATAMARHKQVLAVHNLSLEIFNAQKHISQRLDMLNRRLDEASKSSEKLAQKTYWLTWALVGATSLQAIAAVVSILILATRSNG